MDRRRDSLPFLERLTALAELFDAALSPAKQALYFEALADLEFEQVVEALNAAIRTCRFMPKPVEIRALAVGDDEDRTEQAWSTLRTAMRQVGYASSVIFEDGALGEAVTALFGSWPEACSQDLSPEMWASTRKAFGRVYRVTLQRQRTRTGERYLPGWCEHQNAGRGLGLKHAPVARVTMAGSVRRLGEDETRQAQIAAGILPPLRQELVGVNAARD